MKGRRRGAELEEALLEAAWIELTSRGYAGLTMEGVAARAGTSRPVLARRWEGKAELAIAAIQRQMARSLLDVEDLGDLRAELLAYLHRASARVKGIAVIFTLFSSEYFDGSRSTPQNLRNTLISGDSRAFAAILDRAVQRGEIDPKKLVPPVTGLLSDLFRHHAIMNFSAPPPELRTAWVDKIFLPLVRPG